MELRDGFIDGVFNYCDRWCETCALTSWCRLFADDAQAVASLDPQLKALVDAPALRQETKQVPAWMEELLEKLQDGIDKMRTEEPDEPRTPIDDPLLQRASAYGMTVHTWLDGNSGVPEDPNQPRAVIAWFATLIPAKIARALHGLGYADLDDPDEPTDYDGSAKVALLGIARSRAAWQQLAATDTAADPAIAELTWLETEIDRMFPRARQFVRPAFDEPDEVARLFAERDTAQ
jgi:hypothetical protein